MLAIESPLLQFFDLDGQPLDSGAIYIGTANLNPETSPLTVYWDSAGTQPASQPIATLNGYPERAGTPAQVYVSSDYSITVRNSKGVQVFYAASSANFSNSSLVLASLTAFEADLANTADAAKGDALIGVKRTFIGAQATTQHAVNERRVIQAKADLGCALDGVSDDTSKLAAGLTALSSIGGTLEIEEGTALISSLLTLPANVVMRGRGMRATIIKQSGAAFALKMGAACLIADLQITGTASALGGIDASGVGIGEIQRVDISNMSNAAAVALKLSGTYRLRYSYGYIFNIAYGISFAGNNTTFVADKVNFSTCTNRAIDASGGSGNSIEAYFRACYFESCGGLTPIYSDQTGRIVFDKCGFEDMCASGASPRMASFYNPTRVAFKSCQFSGWNIGARSYTGTAYMVYLGDDAPMAVFDDVDINQSAALSGATFYFLRQLGVWTGLGLSNVRCYGTGFATDIAATKYLLGGFDTTYFPRCFAASNVRVRGSYLYQRVPAADVNTSVVTATGASTTVWSKQFPAKGFGPGSYLRITAWGRRIGVVNTKRAVLSITDNTTTSWVASPALTPATDWRTEITIQFDGPAAESISITSMDGTALTSSSNQATKDSGTYDLTIALALECVGVGDSMTLDGLVLEQG